VKESILSYELRTPAAMMAALSKGWLNWQVGWCLPLWEGTVGYSWHGGRIHLWKFIGLSFQFYMTR